MNGRLFRILYFAEFLLTLLLFSPSIQSLSLKPGEKITVDDGINLLRKAQHPNFWSLSLSELDKILSQDLDRHGTVPNPKEMIIKFSEQSFKFHMQLPSANTTESCKNAKLLVVVYDRPESFAVRNAIRQAWAENLPDGVVVKFILGMRGNNTIDNKMLEELKTHDDLILSTLDDSYRTLFLKVAASYHWHQSFCPMAKYFLKTDDDMTVVLDRLLHWIEKRFEPIRQKNPAVEFGWPLRKMGVVRDPKDKLYTSKEEYAEDVYPDFLAGGAYLLSDEAVKRIIETTDKVHSLTIEDTLYTGIIAKEANISVEDASDIIAVWGQDKTSKCVDGVPLLTINSRMSNDLRSPEKHKQYFDELKNVTCSSNSVFQTTILAAQMLSATNFSAHLISTTRSDNSYASVCRATIVILVVAAILPLSMLIEFK